jgi:diphosphomevalonate decarboxylase
VNIALVKYWGKRDDAANLPAVGSISLTLDGLYTQTTVRFDDTLDADRFTLDGQRRDDPRVVGVLDAVRSAAKETRFAAVTSANHVPTAAGLASSASGMAALGLAGWAAAGLPTSTPGQNQALVDLIRRGSGSAPRSLLGGLVELDRETGQVQQLCAPKDWPLCMVVAVIGRGEKTVKSRPGMQLTRATSPYYAAWVESQPLDMTAARDAIAAWDLPALGAIMERSTLRMHACMLGADPPLRYLSGRTLDVLDAVQTARAAGLHAWCTMDAGPHVKTLCRQTDAEAVAQVVRTVPGIESVRICAVGMGAHLVQ